MLYEGKTNSPNAKKLFVSSEMLKLKVSWMLEKKVEKKFICPYDHCNFYDCSDFVSLSDLVTEQL